MERNRLTDDSLKSNDFVMLSEELRETSNKKILDSYKFFRIFVFFILVF